MLSKDEGDKQTGYRRTKGVGLGHTRWAWYLWQRATPILVSVCSDLLPPLLVRALLVSEFE